MDVVRDQIIHLVIGEIALLFAHIDQFFNIVEFVFKSQTTDLISWQYGAVRWSPLKHIGRYFGLECATSREY